MRFALLTEDARYPMFFKPNATVEVIGEIDVSMEGEAIYLVRKQQNSSKSGANANIKAYIDREEQGWSKWTPYDGVTTLKDCRCNAKVDNVYGFIWLRGNELDFLGEGNKGMKGTLMKLEVD